MAEYNTKSIRYHGVLLIKTFSLIIIYAVYGLLQERIIKGGYPLITNKDGNANFHSPPLLVFCNRVMSLITGIILSLLQPTNALHYLLPKVSQPSSTSATPSSFPATVTSFIDRIRPTSPLLYYALVAGLNNAATLSQYASLSCLSFTTSTLGKSAKMVPVLIIGRFWYSKRYKCRQWVGALLVVLGIWGYLSSLPEVDSTSEGKWIAVNKTWLGILCLLAYLFFDGRTSTLQERLFGDVNRNKEETSTLVGITSGVIDQMIWVNFFSSIIALSLLLLFPGPQTSASIHLVLCTPLLQIHIILLSFTATLGLVLLFHVIATYGALVASLAMTIRQFISVVANAATFGTAAQIPVLGWAGIGIMVAGVWIKMDTRFDGVKQHVGNVNENGKRMANGMKKENEQRMSLMWQYGFPIIVSPVTFILAGRGIEILRMLLQVDVGVRW